MVNKAAPAAGPRCRHRQPLRRKSHSGLRFSLSVPRRPSRRAHVEEFYDFTCTAGHGALYAEAPKLENHQQMPGLQEVQSDLQIKTPRISIVLDATAAALQLNWNTVSALLRRSGRTLVHDLRANQPVPGPGDAPDFSSTDGLDMIYLKTIRARWFP